MEEHVGDGDDVEEHVEDGLYDEVEGDLYDVEEVVDGDDVLCDEAEDDPYGEEEVEDAYEGVEEVDVCGNSCSTDSASDIRRLL